MEENSNDGDSTLYAGFGYIGIILRQLDKVTAASDEAYANRGLYCLKWLNQIRQLYPLIVNQTTINTSKEEIDFNEITVSDNGISEKIIKINKSDKYIRWFNQIESMIERNSGVQTLQGISPYTQAAYKKDKKILSELHQCEIDLLNDANSRYLLMPEGRKDMKDLVKKEWIDRAKKKNF